MSRFALLPRGRRNGHATGADDPAAISPGLHPPAADPRVLRGRAEFDSVFGDLAKGKRNWQLAFFGLLGVTGVLAIGVVSLATRARITPYVVEVDRLGRAQAFGPAERLRLTDQRVVTSQLAGFVRDVRTVLADPAGQADLVRRAFAYADQDAAAFLNAYFATPANDPRALSRTATRLVEVTSVLPVPGRTRANDGMPGAWKVSWTETMIPRAAGGTAVASAWEGYFSTRVVPPVAADRLTANPLGLYVTAVNWTQLGARPLDASPLGGLPPGTPAGLSDATVATSASTAAPAVPGVTP